MARPVLPARTRRLCRLQLHSFGKLRDWTVVPRGLGLLVKLGTISYAVYLWNYPISWWLRDTGAPEVPVTTVVLSILAGTLSWLLVERPVARFKARLDRQSAGAQPAKEPVDA